MILQNTGAPINTDLSKANEITKDKQKTTNINIESQTIEYALNPSKFRDDLDKAKQEIKDVGRAINESLNDRGDDNRNFFGQLREIRLNETINNIAGERLERAATQEDTKGILEAAYKDLGYDVNIRFSTPGETSELKDKGGTAYKGDDGKHTIIINSEYLSGKSKGEILGVISEEASHVINSVEGRAIATGTDEKGLESTGRATRDYFEEKYKDDKTTITLTSEGSIDTSKLGTNVGDSFLGNEVDIRKSNYYKSAQTTLNTKCGGKVECLAKLYNFTPIDANEANNTNNLVINIAQTAEAGLVSLVGLGVGKLTIKIVPIIGKEAVKVIGLTSGGVKWISDAVEITKTDNTYEAVYPVIVAMIEKSRADYAERRALAETQRLKEFLPDYHNGKMPTRAQIDEYNRYNGTNYSYKNITTRLWRIREYYKNNHNPDYYVVPRRLDYIDLGIE